MPPPVRQGPRWTPPLRAPAPQPGAVALRGGAGQVLHASGADPDDLTARELEVLRRLALGRSNKEIASELCIGEETVKTHIGHVLAKLQVENRAQAIVAALKRGLVTLEELQ